MKHAYRELRRPVTIVASFQRRTPRMGVGKPPGPEALISPKGRPLRSHIVGWKYLVHLDTPTVVGWIIGSRAHQASKARKLRFFSVSINTTWYQDPQIRTSILKWNESTLNM